MCRQTDQLVDEHSQENAYKPIEFKEKYAKRSSTQYLVSGYLVAALRCAVLCCAVLRCAVLCCAVLCCAVLRCDFLCGMQALLKKFSIAYWRTPEYNYIRFITTVILGFVLGTLYWKIGHKR